MAHIRLIHWKEAEARERTALLEALGYNVKWEPFTRETLLKLRKSPPEAVVIDLSRVPSHGRDVALALRQQKATRRVPLVLVGGAKAKVDGVRGLLPDAIYTDWELIEAALSQAIANPPQEPVVPGSVFAAYSGKPLVVKLGIKEGFKVVLLNAPEDFAQTLGDLPPGAALRRTNRGRRDLTVWFTRSEKELLGGIGKLATAVGRGGLWIAWPKKASGVVTDLSHGVVQRAGLDAGLMDYKICAFDATWSGLRFTRRRESTKD
ncbi:MAG: hypothetical protein IIB43_04350 [Candidatus Marinimicrobia bacterium]|nr:hypothetical protein [Candidatus Neomarinimicrobiota bacterium]